MEKLNIYRAFTTIYVKNLYSALEFYLDELDWFNLYFDYGDNQVKLISRYCDSFGVVLIQKNDTQSFSKTNFEIEVNNIEEEFIRLSRINFTSGAKFSKYHHTGEIIGTPLGKFIWLYDPSDNLISIYESNINSEILQYSDWRKILNKNN